jgi:predicted AlkP superfamily pyrophosphatase or phosphodiesterase
MKSFLLISILFITTCSSSLYSQKSTPKLVVGIVVDQMCYEYLYRYQSKFSKNGFKKLMYQGTNCRNTQYNYIPTYTGPGHASIYTGTTPENHHIVGNEWFDRKTGKTINCVDDFTVNPIGTSSDDGKCSPFNLKAITITDQLRLNQPQSKVFSFSIKDRGAILPGGHLSNGSFWYDFQSGNLISSSFYANKLPQWVEEFNKKEIPLTFMQNVWKTYYPIETYTESGQDSSKYEQLIFGNTSPTFPYHFNQLSKEKQLKAFTATPFANTFLMDAAIQSIHNESLGQDNSPDFLAISFSSTDILGHSYGTQSIEIEDMYIRLDQEIERLLSHLEEKIGKENFVLFLTADHAVVPVPQMLVDKKLPGGYFYRGEQLKTLKEQVIKEFGADLIQEEINHNIYLNQPVMQEKGIPSEKVQQFIASKILAWDHILCVLTAEQISKNEISSHWQKLIRAGYVPNVSGEIIYALESGFLSKEKESASSNKGTSHGTGFSYDTHVPLLWYGAKIPTQEIFRKIEITDITATLVHLLNLSKPSQTTGEPILEIVR